MVWQEAVLPMCATLFEKLPHQDATELHRLPKAVVAAWGAVIVRFYGVVNLYPMASGSGGEETWRL